MKKEIDCWIYDLNDKTTRSSANALRYSEPDQLLQYLMTCKDETNN